MADKYYRLVTFVVNICPKPLRALFVSKAETDPNCQYTDLRNYLNFRKREIRNIRQIRPDQVDLIFPAVEPVDIEKWDVTLLILLLKQLFPQRLQQTERVCLRDITEIRNSLQHIASTEIIDDQDFNTSWTRLKDAVVSLKQISGTQTLGNIEDEISSVLTDNMPALGDVRIAWQKSLLQNSELANEVKSLKEEQRLQHSELKNEVNATRKESLKANKILSKAAVKKKGRRGVPQKRIKVFDPKIAKMKEKLARSLSEENDCVQNFKEEISEIIQELSDSHRVIVTGYDNKLTYKCALAAIQENKNVSADQCLEVSNPSDWRRICSEDAQICLFREPFGMIEYDSRKVEVMYEEFENMLQATDDDNDDVMGIIIVSNQRLLNVVKRRNDHEMLSSSTIYINSTTSNAADENITPDDSVQRNLLDMSKMLKKTHEQKQIDRQATEKAEQLFMIHKMLVIAGPTGSGKTSLSFDLLSLDDLSNGDEIFFVISDPGELKYVKLAFHPVIIIKFLNGGRYDQAEAWKWYNQFDRLYAGVQTNQIAVITIIDSKVFRKIPATILQHPVLQHIVHLPGIRKGSEDSTEDLDTKECGVQTDDTSSHVLPNGYDTEDDESRLRSVVSVQDYDIGDESQEGRCAITNIAVLPSGNIILVDIRNDRLVKLNTDYKITSIVHTAIDHRSLCFIGNDTVVLCRSYQLSFVDVRDNMSVIKSVSLRSDDYCRSLTCHSGKLYVLDEYAVYVYSTDGKYLRVLYKSENEEKFGSFYDIVTNHVGTKLYIITGEIKLITIDNSGDHLFTLDLHKYDNIMRLYPYNQMCVDDRGFVILLSVNKDDKDILVQISPDGRRCYGTLFQFQNSDKYRVVQFDSHKNALVLTGRWAMKIKVLTLR